MGGCVCGGVRWRDLEAVLPLQAVYSGARDSQLILFTFYSLWDFRVCACVSFLLCVCIYIETFTIRLKTEVVTLEKQRGERGRKGSWLGEVMKPHNQPSHFVSKMIAMGVQTLKMCPGLTVFKGSPGIWSGSYWFHKCQFNVPQVAHVSYTSLV